jgi:hypothetical protein
MTLTWYILDLTLTECPDRENTRVYGSLDLKGSIACNALKDSLMPIVIEKPNLRISKSQYDIIGEL